MDGKDEHRYDDIIALSRPLSLKHPPMPPLARAAQFAPFAALTGYDAAIRETARLTDTERELGDCARMELDAKLRILREHLHERPQLSATCFQPDERKAGGRYITITGRAKRLREPERELVLTDGTVLALDTLAALEGDVFTDVEF